MAAKPKSPRPSAATKRGEDTSYRLDRIETRLSAIEQGILTLARMLTPAQQAPRRYYGQGQAVAAPVSPDVLPLSSHGTQGSEATHGEAGAAAPRRAGPRRG